MLDPMGTALDTAAGFQRMQGFMGSNGDLNAHEQTYSGFTALMKWGAVATFIVGMIVILIISR